ncbi:MAG: type VI secretion system baseplate subunit TssF [Burkholderiales bacterium]|nr:type VI secretion system baseplate subunit TssF [Burkholderiales bacterium]
MDPQLTRLYQDELTHLREMGREFAIEHPKIAARLGLESLEVADPYVERLLEGFAFLTARIRLKLDAEQPQLIAQLIESMTPNFLAPLPSMMIVRLDVDVSDPNLVGGCAVVRGTAVHSLLPRGRNTMCEFRTASALTLWPIEIVQVQYYGHAPDLALARLPALRAAAGGLRIRLRSGGGLAVSELGLDRLIFFIAAPDDAAFRLHELVLGQALGSLVVEPGASEPVLRWQGRDSVRAPGYEADEALLPETLRGFSGHRLIQELSAMPQRFLFFEVGDLASRLAAVRGNEFDLVLPLARADAALETQIDRESLALNCTPAINLFHKRLDRIAVGPEVREYHAVPDRTRPMDFEIHHIDSVVGHGVGGDATRQFKPLYDSHHERPSDGEGYYTTRRDPRVPSASQRVHGARESGYLGEEVFIALAEPDHEPLSEGLRQLAVQAWVTNRDLPALLPPAGSPGADAWQLDAPGPVTRVLCLRGPTRPATRAPQGRIGWQLVALLAQNRLALGASETAAASSLRDLLRLFGTPGDAAWAHLCDGLLKLRSRQVVRRLPLPGPSSFASGIEIEIDVDEAHFQGASAFLLGMVLDRHFSRHAAINSFTQLTLRRGGRGATMSWPPRIGLREIA